MKFLHLSPKKWFVFNDEGEKVQQNEEVIIVINRYGDEVAATVVLLANAALQMGKPEWVNAVKKTTENILKIHVDSWTVLFDEEIDKFFVTEKGSDGKYRRRWLATPFVYKRDKEGEIVFIKTAGYTFREIRHRQVQFHPASVQMMKTVSGTVEKHSPDQLLQPA